MTGRTHLAVGMIAGTALAVGTNAPVETGVIMVGISSIGSLFPDLDIVQSKLGRLLWPISYPLNLIFGHRGFIHSPLLYLILGIAAWFFFPEYSLYTVAFLLGVTTHLMLDMLNPEGIPLLWPMPGKIHIAGIRTGSIWETVFFAATFILIGKYWVDATDILNNLPNFLS